FSRSLEKITDQISQIQHTETDKGLDPFKVLEMVKEAEKSGFEKMKMLKELAKEEAGNGKVKEESMSQTLLKALAPVLAGAMTAPPRQETVITPAPTVHRPTTQNTQARTLPTPTMAPPRGQVRTTPNN